MHNKTVDRVYQMRVVYALHEGHTLVDLRVRSFRGNSTEAGEWDGGVHARSEAIHAV